MHMCGCVRTFVPRLMELILYIYDMVQPTTPDMDITRLQEDFGDQLIPMQENLIYIKSIKVGRLHFERNWDIYLTDRIGFEEHRFRRIVCIRWL